ncbi:WXG100 family type VII secretion target [Paenibacillus sp. JGP012]|uniref:WXG100 family type VII secretion target n=1 Tax=Paenibacillus sp. JGP012 TaxID=2735914 RepID=UPI00161608FA|nr:WXG100 family type VII secretion target [Paenibacillus sp. JGP012]MBB6019736.1 WXG100 family type VII secretion target [Paenibacillus sp. JGP012]
MSRIQVTPERLFEAAREVEETREQMEDTREELVRLIRWMESMWSGMVRERFLERFEENQPRMIETLENLAHIARELREIGVRFQQADEVSGAAVAGNVATKSIGLKATQSNDGKGYEMKYDPQFHIWLPVNEKGVTDQAALQAYERDHGKIDVTKMGQPPGINPVPEQDLIQLQIEAFELGVNPFTGEPVTDDYAKMMISSLKWSQIVAGIGMVTGSMKNGKGPYKGRGNSAALDKVKQTIRDAKAKRENSGNATNGVGNGKAVPKGFEKQAKSAMDISAKAKEGKIKFASNYHGRLGKEKELEILSKPDAVYVSGNNSQNLIYRKGVNVVIVESKGSSKGNVITSYGPDGARGESGAAIFGGKPTDRGMPVTHDSIVKGNIPTPSGGTMPPATQIMP